jgi:DNA polymerase III sliding clamp (beta) subunit (PCNA family)
MKPILDHFCFDGKTVVAYDDIVALRTPCKVGIEGALPGSKLLSILASSTAEEVACTVDGSEATFKIGRTRLKLQSLPSEDFLFKEPDKQGEKLPLDDQLRKCFDLAIRSADPDQSSGTRTGVTIAFEKKKVTFYSTNNLSLFRMTASHKSPSLAGKAFILPERFYSLLLKLGENAILTFTNKGDVIGVSEATELFGHVVSGADAKQFDAVFDRSNLEDIPKADIPAALIGCLQRAAIVSKELTKLTYAEKRLSLFTESQGCQVQDSVKLYLGEEAIEVYTGVECLLRYLDVAKRIGISKGCIVLEGEGFQVLIAVRTGK